jgi:threonine/homoserine/homoserine lactone efflux protein
MQSAMTGTAWMFMLVTIAGIGWALWMGWMGISAPHTAFREGGHAPGSSGSFDPHQASQAGSQAPPQNPMGHVA